jgi:hypothetical protein
MAANPFRVTLRDVEKPGPKVMRRGLEDFQRIKYGTTLRL